MRFPRILSTRTSQEPATYGGTEPEKLAPPPLTLDFQKLMGRDEVTGLPNRHAFSHVLAQQCALALRMQTRLSLLVVHCDGYTAYAEAHSVGARERHVVELANKLRANCRRAYDVIGSLQAGQFAVLLPFTDAVGAEVVAANLTAALRPPAVAPVQPEVDNDPEPKLAAGLGYVPLLETLPPPAVDDFGYSTLSIGIASYCGKGDLCDLRIMAVAEEACRIALAGGGDRALRRDTPLGPAGKTRLPS